MCILLRKVNNYSMEEYQTKRKYLRHLKKIAEIREGTGRTNPFGSVINLSRTKTRQGTATDSKNMTLGDSRAHNSTERIMRDFTVDKENHRLACKILHMNSSIPVKRYQLEYEQSKKYLWKGQRLSRKAKYLYFKFFDINFKSFGLTSSPDDYFYIYALQNQKKILIAKDRLFQLRKRELKIRKIEGAVLKIEGKNQEGIVKLNQNSLLDITRQGNKVGFVVVEYSKK